MITSLLTLYIVIIKHVPRKYNTYIYSFIQAAVYVSFNRYESGGRLLDASST